MTAEEARRIIHDFARMPNNTIHICGAIEAMSDNDALIVAEQIQKLQQMRESP